MSTPDPVLLLPICFDCGTSIPLEEAILKCRIRKQTVLCGLCFSHFATEWEEYLFKVRQEQERKKQEQKEEKILKLLHYLQFKTLEGGNNRKLICFLLKGGSLYELYIQLEECEQWLLNLVIEYPVLRDTIFPETNPTFVSHLINYFYIMYGECWHKSTEKKEKDSYDFIIYGEQLLLDSEKENIYDHLQQILKVTKQFNIPNTEQNVENLVQLAESYIL